MTSERTKKDIQSHVFFDNYDYGGGEPSETSPGGGLWMNQNKYKSVGDFLAKQKKKRKKIMKKLNAGILQHNDMSLVSTAADLDGVDVFPDNLEEMLDRHHLLAPKDDNVVFEEDLHSDEEEPLEVNMDGDDVSFTFKLDKIPGGDDQDDFVVDEIEVEEPEEKIEVSTDPWKWSIGPGFYDWLKERKASIPRHTGKDLTGIERAISYLEKFYKEVRSAARSDINGQLNVKLLEEVLEELHSGIEALTDRKDLIERKKFTSKKKKRAYDEGEGLVKSAQKIPGIKGIYVSVPLYISSLARSCINGMVSAGKDIERVFEDLSKEYSLTKREKLELLQCLSDSGFPLRRDLGVPLDQEIDTRSEDNVNWMPNYPA